jgi:hypothetical protein
MAQEPSPEGPPHRFAPKDSKSVLQEAETLLSRLHITPHEMQVLSIAMTSMMYGQLLERKGDFYEMVCGIENRQN